VPREMRWLWPVGPTLRCSHHANTVGTESKKIKAGGNKHNHISFTVALKTQFEFFFLLTLEAMIDTLTMQWPSWTKDKKTKWILVIDV
jgi:hypothetical protein